jgi:hypothetical protein
MPDVSDAHTVSVAGFNFGASNVSSALGTLTASLARDTDQGKGVELTWTYTVDANAVEHLNAGQTRVKVCDIAI